MLISKCLGVNREGHLTIGECDTVSLAKDYGTPLYVMDEETIRTNARSYRDSMNRYYNCKGKVLYASKAFCCKEMCRIAREEGMGLDIVSGGELFTALKAGFDPKDIFFHGNNKTRQEIVYALECGVGRFVADNLSELEMLDSLAGKLGKKAHILFRIKPGVDAHTHDFIRTGQIDSKFGFALETGEAEEAVARASGMQHLVLRGIHCHIGSQIFEIEPFELAADIMIGFMAKIKQRLGIEFDELNLGGGFGIKYVASHDPIEYDRYLEKISVRVKQACEKYGIGLPFIYIEPGRSIVGPAGITLYEVGSVKEIPGVRTYVGVDGGMNDNPRYALYQAPYEVLIANKAGEKRVKTVTVAGKCCESGDLIQENVAIQEPEVGDLMAVLATGAYNYSMASNYNRNPRPAVVMVKEGTPRIIVRPESYEDLIRNDV